MIGWKQIPLGDAITLQRGYDLPSQLRRHGVVPVISSAGTSDWHDKAMVTPPGVVTGRYGTIGKLFFIQEPFWPLNTTLYVKNFHENEPRYIYYLLQLLDFNIFSGKSGVPGVNRNDIHAELVCIPNSIEEQQAIVGVLSDADALIDALEQCIAKKRHIKQGAMQELLTGKRRLPGFKGEWTSIFAEKLGVFKGGNAFPVCHQGAAEGDHPFFKVSDMNNLGNEIFMISSNNYISENIRKKICAFLFPKTSIVFAKIGAAIFLERKKILIDKSCIDNNMTAFILDDTKSNFRFIYYFLQDIKLGDMVNTTALPSLSNTVLSNIVIQLPPTLNEQAAIAAVLTAMDEEIAALEAKLSKAKQIKAGMMQELLTGRIRLV